MQSLIKKRFCRNRTRNWENKNNVLLVLHRGMIAQEKDWIRNNYCSACLFVDEKNVKVALCCTNKKTPEKVNEVEECLNGEISSRKNKF